MKNKKWISLAAAIVLTVTALPMTAFAAKKDGEETEDFPDAPNHPDFPDTTLLPDAPYSSTTIYRFDIAPM